MNLTLVENWRNGGNRIPLSRLPQRSWKRDDCVRVGQINGFTGITRVRAIQSDHLVLEGELDTPPHSPLPLTVGIAYSRPKMFRRSFESIVELGVKDIHIFRSFLCEKSYERSSRYDNHSLKALTMEALEQSCDTVLPRVQMHNQFKPFLEDVLLDEFSASNVIIAHPNGSAANNNALGEPKCVLIGPERGFSKTEISLCENHGTRVVSFGDRHLRYETAIPYVVGRLTSPSF